MTSFKVGDKVTYYSQKFDPKYVYTIKSFSVGRINFTSEENTGWTHMTSMYRFLTPEELDYINFPQKLKELLK